MILENTARAEDIDLKGQTSAGSSSSGGEAEQELICPLTNGDGSECRKRCLGEHQYRSMQEHIRRAHPDRYIPVLAATWESLQLMTDIRSAYSHGVVTVSDDDVTSTVPSSHKTGCQLQPVGHLDKEVDC